MEWETFKKNAKFGAENKGNKWKTVTLPPLIGHRWVPQPVTDTSRKTQGSQISI